MWDACFVHSFFVLWLVVFHLVIGSQFGHDLPKANLNANSASHEFIFESHGGRFVREAFHRNNPEVAAMFFREELSLNKLANS